MEEIGELDVAVMYRLSVKIAEENRTEMLRRTWLQYLPLMTMKMVKEVTFEEYLARNTVTYDTRPTEEILAEVDQVRRELNGSV